MFFKTGVYSYVIFSISDRTTAKVDARGGRVGGGQFRLNGIQFIKRRVGNAPNNEWSNFCEFEAGWCDSEVSIMVVDEGEVGLQEKEAFSWRGRTKYEANLESRGKWHRIAFPLFYPLGMDFLAPFPYSHWFHFFRLSTSIEERSVFNRFSLSPKANVPFQVRNSQT